MKRWTALRWIGGAEPSDSSGRRQLFERTCLPHLRAAYNLARWLTQNDQDAEDVVQESYLRALHFFDSFRGGDGRPWLLAIVRNTCYSWLQENRPAVAAAPFDEEQHSPESEGGNPEALALESAGREGLRTALEELPARFREVLILRELEGLSYREIAAVTGLAPGTVMSRLARARRRLADRLGARFSKEAHRGL